MKKLTDREVRDSMLRRVERLLIPEPMSGCTLWLGNSVYEYALVDAPNRPYRVTRLLWEEAHGPIPVGLYVLHNCDNPACCNIDHLRLGTAQDNQLDMARRRRGRRTKSGLPYGVYRKPSGRFQAKVCLLGAQHNLGTFDTVEEAHDIAVAKKVELLREESA